MQQRRLRLGDIVDDYCPRERRLTNHAIVAMIEDDIKQVRCTTCDTEHEFKQGKMPTLRKKKEAVSAAYNEVLAAVKAEAPTPATPSPAVQAREAARAADESAPPVQPVLPLLEPDPEAMRAQGAEDDGEDAAGDSDDAAGRVHRRLIRATLPRPENHQVVRPVPEFTMRQPIPRPGKFRGGAARNAGAGRPGAGRNGNVAGNSRGPVFGRSAGGRGGAGQPGRPGGGRAEGHRHPRGGQPSRPGKKHSK
jgi:hypothetical protein